MFSNKSLDFNIDSNRRSLIFDIFLFDIDEERGLQESYLKWYQDDWFALLRGIFCRNSLKASKMIDGVHFLLRVKEI